MATSLLTLYAVAKAWSLAFWRTPAQAHEARVELADGNEERDLHERLGEGDLPDRLPRTMLGATISLVGLSLVLAVVAGPLFGYTERAASDLLRRTPYVDAVLPEEMR